MQLAIEILHSVELFWEVRCCLPEFSDLGPASDPCTAACPSFSLSRGPFLPLPRMWNTFCRPGIFTREFVGKTGDGGNCRGGVMRGSRLSRPLTSNASHLFYSNKQRLSAFLFKKQCLSAFLFEQATPQSFFILTSNASHLFYSKNQRLSPFLFSQATPLSFFIKKSNASQLFYSKNQRLSAFLFKIGTPLSFFIRTSSLSLSFWGYAMHSPGLRRSFFSCHLGLFSGHLGAKTTPNQLDPASSDSRLEQQQ